MTRNRWIAIGMLLALVGVMIWWWGLKVVTGPLLWAYGNPAWFVAGLTALAAVVWFGTSAELEAAKNKSKQGTGKKEQASGTKSESDPAKQAKLRHTMRITGALTGVGILASAAAFFFLPYGKAVAYSDTYESSDAVPSYADRAPFTVAEQLSNRDLDDVIGDRVGVHAVQSADQPNQYTTLVVRRGWFQGYEAVQTIRPPLVGADNASTACRMDPEHTLRLGGGVPSNNLGRAISFQRPLAFFDDEDAYGFCDGDEAVVVVPLKRWGGIWPVAVEKPAGVAVYRGGELTVLDGESIGDDLIGPTYPRTIAAQQRAASTATGSFTDWLFNRAGFDTAGDTAEGDDEPNRGNAVDFSLMTTDGEGQFVTALTPVGASESVVAAGHVSFRQTGKDLNPYVVSRYERALPALSTSENRIRSDFNHLPGWASGMRVMEITPSADGTYVASIGQNQVVTYRAVIETDGSVRMVERDADAPGETPGDEPSEDLPDLTTMSNEELVAEIERMTKELASRAEGE